MQASVVIRGRSLGNNGSINCRYLRIRQQRSAIMVPVAIATIKVMRHLCLLDIKIVLAECLAFNNARYSVCDLHTCCPQELYLAWIICLQHAQLSPCAVCLYMTQCTCNTNGGMTHVNANKKERMAHVRAGRTLGSHETQALTFRRCDLQTCGRQRLLTMSMMLLIPRSARILVTDVYSRQSSGRPRARLASTVSRPVSCHKHKKCLQVTAIT